MSIALAPHSTLFVHLALANGLEPMIRWTCPVASCAVSIGTGMIIEAPMIMETLLCEYLAGLNLRRIVMKAKPGYHVREKQSRPYAENGHGVDTPVIHEQS